MLLCAPPGGLVMTLTLEMTTAMMMILHELPHAMPPRQ
jgi:hypothetical protein